MEEIKDATMAPEADKGIKKDKLKEKKEKEKKEKEKKERSRKINIRIAPGNWGRLERYVENFNANPERTASKMKFTDIINEAVGEHFAQGAN